jgi:purine-binding chemotaxis protein CheW
MSDGRTGPVPAAGSGRGGKFLTFFLDDEEYGLEILKVQEIIGLMPITRVPRTPAYLRGVVNLRGKVIPVVELRAKFAMETVPATDQTCIIVVQAGGTLFGAVVDRVSEVVDLAAADVEDTPSFGADLRTDYILGMGKAAERVTILLDIDRVLSHDELERVRSLDGDAAA